MSKQEWPPVRAVLLDWAGTTIDFGSRAPVQVFVEVFRQRGIGVSEAEARGPMGMAKDVHIATVLHLPRVAAEWERVHGRAPGPADVAAMYADFLPLQKQILAAHSVMIPGVVESVRQLEAGGIRIGSTTGYTRALMDVVIPLAAAAGYQPEAVVCADEVPAGRPAPDLNRKALQLLGLDDPAVAVAVDDTPVGIAAGLASGMRTIAVSATGNALGLSEQEFAALGETDRDQRLQEIESGFRKAGAQLVIRSVADLPAALRQAGWL